VERSIEYRRVRDLVPDPRNPKDHAAALIDASISRFGYVEPIVEDGRTGQLISGHGRMESLLAAEVRGDAPPDGIVVEDGGAWLVPVVTGWASGSDVEAEAALIALNRAGEVGGWDQSDLIMILSELSEQPDGFLGVGFDEAELERLLRIQESLSDPMSVLDEWEAAGMSGLGNENLQGVYHVHVSFATRDDYEEFRRRLGLEQLPRTRIWFPEKARESVADIEHIVSA
jgi:hypothetical protein